VDQLRRDSLTFVRFVVVAGLSGAGKSQAMKSFEDLGFHCVDNLPPALLLDFVGLARQAGTERLALALDVRSHGAYGEALASLDALRGRGIGFELLFLDANDRTIVRRYSETRRRHPLCGEAQLLEAIARERRELATLRARADRIWDTSDSTLAALKARVVSAYAPAPADHALAVSVVTFGFKFGLPQAADLVFDVRFLPNPNYVEELRPLTGSDAPVIEYFEAQPVVAAFLERLYEFVDFLIPRFGAEGKSHLTIAIGCTGGRHRSVYVAEQLARHLAERPDVRVEVQRREATPA
jgi:RNase adapter protein RapZ